ncbi:MAG TPA: 3-methyl-2-oxobutanoate hydroxymethyltransferase [Polyangiaceae bacterium]|nr:3-methyl-2-oxobutanoate hydroxymethyltransferase [Polyangiaceae bacterium]
MHKNKITVPDLIARKAAGPKISVLTAYDATMARLFDDAGVDVLLVGDSLGMVVQGQANTLGVTIEDICYHGRAVARGTRRAHLVGDLPFMSFQGSADKALESAGRLLKEGSFEAVKLEGGARYAEHVRLLVESGIPTMGHLGLLPQSVHAMGGFRVQGRDDASAERILRDARVLEEAGAYAIVLEGIPMDLARRVTESITIPTIGIGAGPHCDGQVLVCYDFLGMYSDIRPKFVKRFAELGDCVAAAAQAYVSEVQSGAFPGIEHSFGAAPPRPRPKTEETYPRLDPAAPATYGPASEESV